MITDTTTNMFTDKDKYLEAVTIQFQNNENLHL